MENVFSQETNKQESWRLKLRCLCTGLLSVSSPWLLLFLTSRFKFSNCCSHSDCSPYGCFDGHERSQPELSYKGQVTLSSRRFLTVCFSEQNLRQAALVGLRSTFPFSWKQTPGNVYAEKFFSLWLQRGSCSVFLGWQLMGTGGKFDRITQAILLWNAAEPFGIKSSRNCLLGLMALRFIYSPDLSSLGSPLPKSLASLMSVSALGFAPCWWLSWAHSN